MLPQMQLLELHFTNGLINYFFDLLQGEGDIRQVPEGI